MAPLAPPLHVADIYTPVRLLEWHRLVPRRGFGSSHSERRLRFR